MLGDNWLGGRDLVGGWGYARVGYWGGVFLGGALGIVAGSGGAGRCKGALIYAFA